MTAQALNWMQRNMLPDSCGSVQKLYDACSILYGEVALAINSYDINEVMEIKWSSFSAIDIWQLLLKIGWNVFIYYSIFYF